MKLTYFYLLSADSTTEYQATSLIQLIKNSRNWPSNERELLDVLGDFVAHSALFSTLHTNKWEGFASTCADVLGLYITKIVTPTQTLTTQFHATSVAKHTTKTKNEQQN